jgi:hypothetical protein
MVLVLSIAHLSRILVLFPKKIDRYILVCSKLIPPQNLKFTDEKLLQWDKVPEATSYKVSYRKEKGSRFRDIVSIAFVFDILGCSISVER